VDCCSPTTGTNASLVVGDRDGSIVLGNSVGMFIGVGALEEQAFRRLTTKTTAEAIKQFTHGRSDFIEVSQLSYKDAVT
jgi:hypothetical protein